MTLISNLKGPYHGQPVVLIPNKLYFACYEDRHLPTNDEHCVYIPINEYVHYDAFYDDFGPYNLAVLYRFVKALDVLLKSKEKRKVVCCASADERDRVNGAYLMAGFMIFIAGYSAEKALALVVGAQPPPFIGFRDASLGPPLYNLPIQDCVRALEKAVKLKWFDFQTFNPDEYEHYERVENGDFNWIIPTKILSFCGPHNKSYVEDEYPYHSPETYFDYFKKHNVTTIVRLNKKLYSASRFTSAGFDHHDLFFIDGSTPSDEIVNRFIEIVDNSKGGVAIHCKAGLGRTGTLIACWMMKEYRVTAAVCMAWLRICRPGSVIGPQQLFLLEKQSYCWALKGKNRSPSPKRPIKAQTGETTTKVVVTSQMKSPTEENNQNNLKTSPVIKKSPKKDSPNGIFDETAMNELGQTQGDRLLCQKARRQHQLTEASNIIVPPVNKSSPRYSSATTPIKQLKVSSKRIPAAFSKPSASRSLLQANHSNGFLPASSAKYLSSRRSGQSNGNIPISRVTVSSTPSSLHSTPLRTTIAMAKKSRTHPYPSTNNSLSSNLSKIMINKYELRPRKGLHSPERFEPGKNLSPTSASILAIPRDTRQEILVSYLAAVSQFPKDLFESIQHLSEVDSNEAPDTNDTHYFNRLSQCFRTDFEGSMISGALQVAIEEINSNPNLLSDYRLVYIFNNTCGNEKKSTEFFMDHWKKGAKVFIGPEMNCRTEATMAASQNLPIISYKCKDQTVSNKKKYPTFARTVPAETEITRALLSLLKHFGWHKFTIIYEKHSRNEELHSAIKAAIEEENDKMKEGDVPYSIRNVSIVAYPFSEVEKTNVEQIITDTHVNTRIYLTFGNVRLFRRILLVMGALGLMDNGEYVLIYLDTDYNWHNVYHAMNNHFFRDTLIEVWESWDKPDSPDRQVVNFSKTALAIIPTPVKLESNKFIEFWEKANNYLVNFGVQKHDTALSIKANRFACYLYDAVMLYAEALNELVKEFPPTNEYNPLSDGTAIISKIRGRKYTSMQGFDMRINENGDAQGNYTLLSLQSVPPVMNATDPDYYPLDSALMISADFVEDEEDSLPKLRFSRKINWPNEQHPLDEPACGFQNEKCLQEDNWRFQLVMGASTLFVFTILLVSTALVYRNRKFEKELSMIWRINPSDLEKCVQCYTSTNSLYCMERSRNSLLNNEREDLSNKRFISRRGVARYKGTVVAIKEMSYSRKTREITRATKLEMKAMRQLHHDNINSFIGIIIFPMSICVVREFCAKGSLNEILVMTDFKLDELFIASFMQDLLRGMIYLHESEVKVHGNLKSTNCLITSRWALQVADFGLHEIREGQEWDSPELIWESYLWTAPELLRECELVHAVKGTQKGDVYSFGIILHEVMAREGPFHLVENPHSTAEQVVRRVAEGSMYRPSTDKLTCNNYVIDTMTLCWSEVPEHRPDFRHGVRAKLKPMFDHISGKNIVEYMMDRYLQTLEELVEERTAQLKDEKRRTENLLQRMLPISVANQLIAGKDVEPESFPSVTIYFSDIVGFTSISGQSTPMQVVNFLNKLYTLFDAIIKQYEVYKVETIGDAYMVVAGVPKQHEEEFNAEQIGTMALHLLAAVESFKIPHRPEEQLKLRIGIHTGPVVAGVVGKTMPRYCLFGDTVNTASRMETYGESLKIHCSESFQRAVKSDMGFVFEDRGEREIKGKGKMRTFWLLEKIGHHFLSSDESDLSEDELAPEIFPRASMKMNRGLLASNWSVKTSSLSLQKEAAISTKFLKRLVEKASAMTPSLTRHEGSSPKRKSPKVFRFNQKTAEIDCESQFSTSTQTNVNNQLQANSCSSVSSMNQSSDRFDFGQRSANNLNASYSSTLSSLAHPAIRKRSTSLPDGEVLKINHFNPHQLACTAPNSSFQSPVTVHRKNAMAVNYEGTFDQMINKKKSRDEAPAPRKRSLSYGDNATEMSVIASNDSRECNANSPLITPPAQRKKRFRKERKSALSLQYNFEHDIMAKKPIGHASLRERSPVTSFNRIWRRITMPMSEGDSGIGSSKESSGNQSGLRENSSHHPLLPMKLMIPDESLDKLLEETDNSTLNGSHEEN